MTTILHDTYTELEKEIELTGKLRSETAKLIQEAAAHGDLKENYDYKAAKEKMDLVVYRRQLLQSFAPFKYVDFDDIDTEDVSFGNKVSILEEGKDEPELYFLLGPVEQELDLYPDIVTYHTPFAQSIIGKEVNDTFTLEIEGKDTKFTITSINNISKKDRKK